MFCPNCGNKINVGEDFCSECGTKIAKEAETLSEKLSKNNPMNSFLNKLFENIYKHKKIVFIFSTFFVIFLILYFSVYMFYDFTQLSWNPKDKDSNVTYTEPTTINLSVLAFDRENKEIKNIKFKVDNGDIKIINNSVSWELPDKEGKYTITATAPSGKSISKTINVVKLNEENNLFGTLDEEINDTDDTDNDGLSNLEEKEKGTNPFSADSDGDGLSDYIEIFETKTDPLKEDTDEDGINDGNEMDLELDPLKKDSKNDGINDGDRILNYTIKGSRPRILLSIEGQGNIASSTIDVLYSKTFRNKEGFGNHIYNFYTTGKIKEATVEIYYSLSELQENNIQEENLTLYYFDEIKNKLEIVPTTVDTKNKKIISKLDHFSKYVLGDKNNQIQIESQIMFVIDNSVSMFNMDLLKKLGYESANGAIGNDIEYKRVSLTNYMIDILPDNYQFGVAEFAGSYDNLIIFNSDKSKVKKNVDKIKQNPTVDLNGTNIILALDKGINEFKNEDNNHYLILLTDGKNTEGNLSSYKEKFIKKANEKNIKICVIGVGYDLDTSDLTDIASQTGCDYYHASNASALDEIYSTITADINYNLVDTNNDNNLDGVIISDSGFIVNRDGFSFQNFKSNKSLQGHCFGMAAFAELYYGYELPLSMDAYDLKPSNTINYIKFYNSIDKHSNGYNLKDTYFGTRKKLYDFKITNEALKIALGDPPADYRDRVENDTWMIKKNYYEEFKKINADISTAKYKGTNFSKYQTALITIDDETFDNKVSKDEAQILKAIWRLFLSQTEKNTKINFGGNPDKAFEFLQTRLNGEDPIILNIGGHAINAIKLIQDNKDSNKFKIAVYDNNYPGETRYIEMTRTKFSGFQFDVVAWTNEYNYTFKYDEDNNGELEDINLTIIHSNIKNN